MAMRHYPYSNFSRTWQREVGATLNVCFYDVVLGQDSNLKPIRATCYATVSLVNLEKLKCFHFNFETFPYKKILFMIFIFQNLHLTVTLLRIQRYEMYFISFKLFFSPYFLNLLFLTITLKSAILPGCNNCVIIIMFWFKKIVFLFSLLH